MAKRWLATVAPPNRLREFRAARRLSQMEVAVALGCGHHRFWRIENGFQAPTEDEKAKLAELFGVRVSKLFPTKAA